jgi:hypothetical protein
LAGSPRDPIDDAVVVAGIGFDVGWGELEGGVGCLVCIAAQEGGQGEAGLMGTGTVARDELLGSLGRQVAPGVTVGIEAGNAIRGVGGETCTTSARVRV